MPVVTCIEDLRELARKRVARAIFDYVDRGSYSEATLRANRADLESLALRQRVGIDVDRRSTRTTMAGHDVAMPVALAPVGLTGLNWADGEILAARAAAALRRAVHALDHVDLLDRGRGRRGGEAVLVPALRDARPRLRRLAHRARQGGEVLGARADPRPAGPGPAPPRPEERLGRAARSSRWALRSISCANPRWALNVLQRQAKVLRQPRRPHPGREQPDHALAVDRGPVRSRRCPGRTSSG